MSSIEQAKKLLDDGGYTCVLCRENEIYTSNQRGVKPLIEFLESGNSFKDFSAADKTVGAGAAYIYVLLGVKEVWARIISSAGLKVLESSGIICRFENQVPYIINRAGNGMCPIEKAVSAASSPDDALEIIKQTLKSLND